jgi:hypothetical protein
MPVALINRVLKKALETFSNVHNQGVVKYDPNFAEIVKLTSAISKEDLDFDLSLVGGASAFEVCL